MLYDTNTYSNYNKALLVSKIRSDLHNLLFAM